MDNEILWKTKYFPEITPTELYAILKARAEVFVVEQHCQYQDMDDKDQKALHIWAVKNEKITAYCRVFAPGIKHSEASIGRVLTTKKHRGINLGRELVKKAISEILKHYETDRIRISAQDYLLNFYKEFGFVDTGKKYLEDNSPHTEMLREK